MNIARRTALLAAAFTAPLWGCPPNLSGEPCNGDCSCPTSQTCVFAADAAIGTCQSGTNACKPANDGGTDAGTDGGTDAGDSGSALPFQGQVVLNGGALPLNEAKVYGFADGTPVSDQSGLLDNGADIKELTDHQGIFGFPGPVPSPTGSGYRFVAAYDTTGNGDYSILRAGTFDQPSQANLAPDSSDARTMKIDIQTSSCYSVTADFHEQNSGNGITYLVGVGAVAYDIQNGAPLTAGSTFDNAFASFDAGSALPPGFVPLGELPLFPFGSVPGSPVSNSWVYLPPKSVELSNSGTFLFTLNDVGHLKQHYPAGTCAVTYAPAPGFPSNLEINGKSSQALWQSSGGGPSQSVMVSWNDATVTDTAFISLGDLISILSADDSQLLPPDGGIVTSPLKLPPSLVPQSACSDQSGRFCTLEITTIYLDARNPHSTPFEGGTTTLTFQSH